jgi:hypothetical protein
MSSTRNTESQKALEMNRSLAQGYYGIGVPALQQRQGEINASLAGGEPDYITSAFQGQRGALTGAMAGKEGIAQRQQWAAGKAALSGGNAMATMNPADLGAQLANALYGSKFAQGQANIDQQFNLMGMALGGAGTAGSSGLNSAQNQLTALGGLPNYNPTYANIVGGAAGAASLYGAYNQNQINTTLRSLTPQGLWNLGFTGSPVPPGTQFPQTFQGVTP